MDIVPVALDVRPKITNKANRYAEIERERYIEQSKCMFLFIFLMVFSVLHLVVITSFKFTHSFVRQNLFIDINNFSYKFRTN